ncbi:uncharacterized protein BDZ83DRAFT_440959 [Colletotrichum acutatum]|uniref:Uncharacterized protein n=1 Tax=Glomerella acutata TaxID=27357 RepID=A0AAD8XEN9_GLOAC|nr:uncharacterized protein BDZ83DRAFT_440959 [Colletotrichum acutatum]KAK1721207.1 hypothetical protein BDZ83DRAFT_440959 [Colletotrichum acutatum]
MGFQGEMESGADLSGIRAASRTILSPFFHGHSPSSPRVSTGRHVDGISQHSGCVILFCHLYFLPSHFCRVAYIILMSDISLALLILNPERLFTRLYVRCPWCCWNAGMIMAIAFRATQARIQSKRQFRSCYNLQRLAGLRMKRTLITAEKKHPLVSSQQRPNCLQLLDSSVMMVLSALFVFGSPKTRALHTIDILTLAPHRVWQQNRLNSYPITLENGTKLW